MRRSDPSLEDPLPDSPLPLLARWLEEARTSKIIRNHDAIALATVDEGGSPRVRMVLARRFDLTAGCFSFYTHRDSPKARQVEAAGRASAVLHWDALSRQVRFEGRVARASDSDSDDYFAARPRASQIAAWASAQSQPIASRAALVERFEETAARFGGTDAAVEVPRPPDWGGYVFRFERVELWVDRPGRLHDRALWIRIEDASTDPSGRSTWRVDRLQP